MSSQKFCGSCNMNVFPAYKWGCGSVFLFILAFIVPLWPITLPLFLWLAFGSRGVACPHCNNPSLSRAVAQQPVQPAGQAGTGSGQQQPPAQQ